MSLKNKVEEELRGRIDQLEKRQTQDDAVINVINRSAVLFVCLSSFLFVCVFQIPIHQCLCEFILKIVNRLDNR